MKKKLDFCFIDGNDIIQEVVTYALFEFFELTFRNKYVEY